MAVAPCGTLAAYRRHLRHGEEPCPACRRANREAKRAQSDARRRAKVTRPAPNGGNRKSDYDTMNLIPSPLDIATRESTGDAPLAAASVLEHLGAPTTPPSASADLRAACDALVSAIAQVRAEDPARLPGLVRELRETWKALRDLTAKGADESPEDEFAKARAAREARKAANA